MDYSKALQGFTSLMGEIMITPTLGDLFTKQYFMGKTAPLGSPLGQVLRAHRKTRNWVTIFHFFGHWSIQFSELWKVSELELGTVFRKTAKYPNLFLAIQVVFFSFFTCTISFFPPPSAATGKVFAKHSSGFGTDSTEENIDRANLQPLAWRWDPSFFAGYIMVYLFL